MLFNWMMDTFGELITGLILGIIVSLIGYLLVEIVKGYLSKRKNLINELNYVTTLLLEVKRAIKRSEYYVDLYVEKRKISLSKIYTYSYDTSLVELIKICSDSKVIDKLNYIYSVFSYVNYNIDKGRELNGVSFIADHLLKIYKVNNELLKIIKSKSVNPYYLIFFFKTPKVRISESIFNRYSKRIEEFKKITKKSKNRNI